MQGGSQFRGWTHSVYLLAAVVNLLNAANRQRAGKTTKSPLVKPPSSKPPARRVSVAQIAARQRALESTSNN